MQAIETHYKGCRFRSRLEARWAVFFDAAGIQWEYEPQGFKGSNGSLYLPDFYLPYEKTHVEIKGHVDALRESSGRITSVLQSGAIERLLILGEVPYAPNNIACFPLLRWNETTGVQRQWATLIPLKTDPIFDDFAFVQITSIEGTILENLVGLFVATGLDAEGHEHKAWKVEHRLICNANYFAKIADAFSKARSARFEHGETPA